LITALLFWIIVGLIAGALAKLIMPGDDPDGIVVTIIIGIVGAVLGGWLLSLLGIGAGAGSGGVDILHCGRNYRCGHTASHLPPGRGS
jgi:uncharacterized membrane protein YeaQ/YmgE (transglycosylase-associated protein family)